MLSVFYGCGLRSEQRLKALEYARCAAQAGRCCMCAVARAVARRVVPMSPQVVEGPALPMLTGERNEHAEAKFETGIFY